MATPSSGSDSLQNRLTRIVEAPLFTRFITAVIILNAIGLGVETSPGLTGFWRDAIHTADRIALGIYCVELALKLAAYRAAFFRSGWNWFDLVIVGVSLVPASGPLAVFRALRVLRVLRLFSVVPRLRAVVDALLGALPGMGSVIVVMGLVFYVAAVMATKLFGEGFPEYFGNLAASMFTLFQVMTLEAWADGIVRPVMERFPYAWAFFLPFIVVTSFAVLNLFIALIVNSMQSQHEAENRQRAEEEQAAVREGTRTLVAEVAKLREEIAALRAATERRQP